MECRHSKTGERIWERSALSRFLLHKYILLNTSQSFILQVSGGKGHFPKGSGTKPHQEQLSSSGVALALLRVVALQHFGSSLPSQFCGGQDQGSLPSFDHFSLGRISFSPHGETFVTLQCQCRSHGGPQVH